MSEPTDSQPKPPDPLPDVDDPGSREAAPPPQPQRARRGGFLAFLALLLGLAALAGSGYLYYELVHVGADRDVAPRLDAAAAEQQRLQRRVDALEQQLRDQRSAWTELRDSQEAARTEFERSLRQSLSTLAGQAPPTSEEWQRAEVHYLLRIANLRLRLERDLPGALSLLRAADAILADLDDFALFDVRARLTDEIAALERVEGSDVQGLFLRLEALKRQVEALPLRLPEVPVPATVDAAEGTGRWWSELVRQVSGYVRVRRLDDPVRPLLAPEEAGYLELNLRLMLERAQLAALRRDDLLYQESLASALGWVEEYFDPDRPVTARIRDELLDLGGIDLDAPLPDISGSLNSMRAAARSPE
jgi:uroporphyrin-III C-methyltransferase